MSHYLIAFIVLFSSPRFAGEAPQTQIAALKARVAKLEQARNDWETHMESRNLEGAYGNLLASVNPKMKVYEKDCAEWLRRRNRWAAAVKKLHLMESQNTRNLLSTLDKR